MSDRARYDYAQLLAATHRLARHLGEHGVTPGTVIGLRCDDDVMHLLAVLACTALGASTCTLPGHDSATQQDHLAAQCNVTVRLTGDDISRASQVEQRVGLPTSMPKSPPAQLLFSTSGTSGQSKIVVLHDSDIVAQAPRHVMSTAERFACQASMEHNFAKRHRLYCVAQGATNVFLAGSGAALIDQCLQHEVSVLHLSAFQARELVATPGADRLAGIRLKLGGSHVPVALREQLRAQVTDDTCFGYGTTETGAIAFTDPNDTQSGDSVGQPLDGMDVMIADAERRPQAPGTTGEIAIRCSGMFRGYLGREELTEHSLADGWFWTGDLGAMDASGRLRVSGRCDDMFVFNSMNIHPQEIEAQIMAFSGVRDAAVVPKPSDVHGSIPVALVVADDPTGLDTTELKRFMRVRAGLRCPRQYVMTDRIPRNRNGKILRAEALAALMSAGQQRNG